MLTPLLSLESTGEGGEFISAWLSFLLIDVSSSQVARIFPLIKLPLITGYLFFGVLVSLYIYIYVYVFVCYVGGYVKVGVDVMIYMYEIIYQYI
jgi:ABC-type multidrug transport system fused ATPase/permease subunit